MCLCWALSEYGSSNGSAISKVDLGVAMGVGVVLVQLQLAFVVEQDFRSTLGSLNPQFYINLFGTLRSVRYWRLVPWQVTDKPLASPVKALLWPF